ncbi:glutathione S-transferase 1-like [Onthophagus taurus]|uniref:glutathione S-transferase 1-like n=1 Tax=Onthophagus taurus TaxID=166361 RepID=UPI000C20D5E2|nr:glutathione S-transferase 1-like [Onthophagus taurus]
MPPKLYADISSPAVRSVLLLSKAINLDLDIQSLDISTGEHLTPVFMKMNPQHTVPTLEDNNFILWDSHAICAYLMNKYSENDDLYPKNPELRATIDQRMHFDSGILFPKYLAVIEPILKEGAKMISKDKAHSLSAAYGILETFLEHSRFVAGKKLSIADFCIATTITTANVLVPVAENRFPGISKWLANIKELPYYEEANQKGLDKFTGLVKFRMGH